MAAFWRAVKRGGPDTAQAKSLLGSRQAARGAALHLGAGGRVAVVHRVGVEARLRRYSWMGLTPER